MFDELEVRDPRFQERNPERLAQYSGTLSGERSHLDLSFAFTRNLDIDPTTNLHGQLHVVAHISAMYREAIVIVEQGDVLTNERGGIIDQEDAGHVGHPLAEELLDALQDWSEEQEEAALNMVLGFTRQDQDGFKEHAKRLTVAQYRFVYEHVSKLVDYEKGEKQSKQLG